MVASRLLPRATKDCTARYHNIILKLGSSSYPPEHISVSPRCTLFAKPWVFRQWQPAMGACMYSVCIVVRRLMSPTGVPTPDAATLIGHWWRQFSSYWTVVLDGTRLVSFRPLKQTAPGSSSTRLIETTGVSGRRQYMGTEIHTWTKQSAADKDETRRDKSCISD